MRFFRSKKSHKESGKAVKLTRSCQIAKKKVVDHELDGDANHNAALLIAAKNLEKQKVG